jgi:Flp pilus assembly protein TadG
MVSDFFRSIRALPAAGHGNVMLEFALALPVISLLLIGMIDLGRYALQQSSILEGARQGAQYGVYAFQASSSGDSNGVNSTARNATGLTGVTATNGTFCECVNGTSVSCTTTCGSGQTLKQYLAVTVSKPFTSIMAATSISFGAFGSWTPPTSTSATLTMIIP